MTPGSLRIACSLTLVTSERHEQNGIPAATEWSGKTSKMPWIAIWLLVEKGIASTNKKLLVAPGLTASGIAGGG